MSFKLSWFLKKLMPFLILCMIGAIFLSLPHYPGELSNIIAKLESDYGFVALVTGSVLIVLGTLSLITTFRRVKQPLQIVHGKLSCFIEQNVIQSVVEQILAEFFKDKNLCAEVTLKRGTLYLNVEIPNDASHFEEFKQYLVDRLFVLVGYYGDIILTTHPKALSSETHL